MKLKENINIDVKVGDTILTGKFKNKKTVIKTIGKDEHGMPTINGRKACNFRIAKKEKIVKESQIRKVIREELLKEETADESHIVYNDPTFQKGYKLIKKAFLNWKWADITKPKETLVKTRQGVIDFIERDIAEG